MQRTFKDFIYHLQGERQLSPNTVLSYKTDISRYLKYLREHNVDNA